MKFELSVFIFWLIGVICFGASLGYMMENELAKAFYCLLVGAIFARIVNISIEESAEETPPEEEVHP